MTDLLDSKSVREAVSEWLAEHYREGIEQLEWIEMVYEAGWACPSWPREVNGLGLPREYSAVVRDEFLRVGATGAGQDLSNIPANTMLAWASDELKAKWLRPLVTGEIRTCLLYSEPGAGSDLAGVQTRAERHDDEWMVNGQKVWTTQGREADYGLLVARTNWDVPKHQGISYFFCPMHQPGVEVRPLIQITGGSSFNEVFLTDARIPLENLIGDEGNGWRVLATALSVERVMLSGMNAANNVQPRSRPAGLVPLAIERGRNSEPEIRQAIAQLYAWQMVIRWNAMRAKAGNSPSAASINKIAQSRVAKKGAELEMELLGMESLLDEPDTLSSQAVYRYLSSFSSSLVGGTDQIQRNIIGERVLGLPREPEVDRDIPFRDVKKASSTSRGD